MPNYRDILQRLVELRNAASPRVTQEAMGKIMHVKQSTISAWETGTNQMGMDEMTAYAKALGWTLRIELAPEAKRTRAEDLYDLVESLPEEEYREIRRMLDAGIKASPDARFMVVGLLEAAVKGRDGQ